MAALLTFMATSAQYYTGVGEFERTQPVLSYAVHLAQGESVKLATGEDFGKIDGRVTIRTYENDFDRPQADKQVGTLYYFEPIDDDVNPVAANYIAEVFVSDEQLNDLLAAARLGRVPSNIVIGAEKLKYDWQPDGSGKKWDNKEQPHAALTSAKFTVPLISPVSADEFDHLPSEDVMPPTRSQFEHVAQKLDGLLAETKTGLRWLLWAVIVMGGLLLFIR